MTTYTTLSDATLSQDKPLPQSVVRAFRDNPKAIAEGDASAPKIDPKALAAKPVLAYRSSNVTVNANSEVVVVFNSESMDVGSFYDSATGKFQPTEPGLYAIGVQLRFGTVSLGGSMFLKKNNSNQIAVNDLFAQNSLISLHTIVSMNGSTDYVEVRLLNGNGNVTINGQSNPLSYLYAYKVGAQ